jgi:6-phosphogluconolactonase
MMKDILAYVGTYTRRGSEGIYVYRFDPSTGDLALLSVAAGVENPTFLAIDPQRRHLYAVNEVDEYAGQSSGAVSAFSIDPETGALTFLNRQPTLGPGPCHLSVDRTAQYVLVANYSGGSVCVLPIGDDGQLGKATDFHQHQGSSINPRRQQGPHAHSINLDPANRFAYVADLGIDKIVIYQLDLDQGKLLPNDDPWVQVHAGAGPRHFAFHPNGEYAYVINELDSTLTAFAYDATRGTLAALQTISTLPEDFQGRNTCADVHIAASGKFLYGSNRGHDSIAIFEVDEDTGQLAAIGHESTQGRTPRNFGIDPRGDYVLAANQDTDTIVTFQMDRGTGRLTATGHVTQVSMPVCVAMVPAPV